MELAGAAIAPHVIEQLRHGRTGAGDRAVEALGLAHLVPTQTVLRELFEWADVIPIPTSRERSREGQWRIERRCRIVPIADRELDVDHIGPGRARRARRCAGASTVVIPIDAFGFDPQIVDLVVAAVHRGDPRRGGGRRARSRPAGPAVLVANRGFGIVEPAVLGIAVRRVASGAGSASSVRPPVPALGGLARRLGAISASAPDMRACLRAGNLVAVPLAPTWLRRGAGIPPRPLLQAMTSAPIVPVAVTPGGPFGTGDRSVAACGSVRS